MTRSPTDRSPDPAPIDMVLWCPNCGEQHIDAPDPGAKSESAPDPGAKSESAPDLDAKIAATNGWRGWTNPPHRSHLCAACGHIWRPADVATNGVIAVKTRGANDHEPVVDHVEAVIQALAFRTLTDPAIQADLHDAFGDNVIDDNRTAIDAGAKPEGSRPGDSTS